jgi:2,3-bisphosphoglycerate-independent phosphoglycerate mutase
MSKKSPLVLMILDGWGYSEKIDHNAISSSKKPQWDAWWKTCPHTLLNASGQPVGLPTSQMGNSEVGHMHIGAGRIIPQDFTRINEAIENGEFAKNPVFLKTINDCKHTKSALHILGLLSPGGVHSHEQHLFSFLSLCAQEGFSNLYLHLFLDGRDTPPQSALKSMNALQAHLSTLSSLYKKTIACIASITGRYYALDRDKRWERVAPVYTLLTQHEAATFDSAANAIDHFYQQGIFDEFIPPTRIGSSQPIQDGDAVFFFNFRADRARELTEALISDSFSGFSRHIKPAISTFISMTPYSKSLATDIAFPNMKLENTLGEVLANHGLSQLRIAETEKYAHVTFFLNGGMEAPFPNETRLLIKSPQVSTYDLQPEMSAPELTKSLVQAIEANRYDVIICNYANADMVGHTGDFKACVLAIECLDSAMKTVWEALNKVGGQLLITADHGNAECLFDDETHQPHTAHTNEPVPFVYVGHKHYKTTTSLGSLIDVAPTVLTLLNLTPPIEMTGHTLLVDAHENL